MCFHTAGEGPFPEGVTMPGDHLRKVFYRMGLNDQEIVALSGWTDFWPAFILLDQCQ